MLKATLVRERTSDLGTFGKLRIEGTDFWCLTGELPWRNNEPGSSCTKADTYLCKVQDSHHFKKPLYHLEDKHGRVAEEIHAGNWCGDIDLGYRTDVKGCILVGFALGDILRPDKKFQYGVSQSRHALERLMEVTKEQPIELTIVWQCTNPEEVPA